MHDSEYLSPKELAAKLKVPVNTIYYWVSRNQIPVIKMGKHNRFHYEEVMSFFRNKTKNLSSMKGEVNFQR